jgi:lipoprotein-anchoring transpeptidase ErfK/SrfK
VEEGQTPAAVAPNVPVALPKPPTSQPADSTAMAPVALAEASGLLHDGLKALDRGEVLIARTALNRVLRAGLPPADLETARQALDKVAEQTIFSRGHVANDPLTAYHTVVSGDTLGLLAKRYRVTGALLQEINGLHNPNHIRAGARLKVIKGPFHATVSKSDHLMHLYLGDTYVRTYRVALGMEGSTPKGRWKVKNKLPNPDWTDPRSGKRWQADDPKNPIGEFWIGLEGVDGDAVGQFGYGIHGTIEPESIGRDVSMGCVRLAAGDIDAVYRMLVPEHSLVTIVEK